MLEFFGRLRVDASPGSVLDIALGTAAAALTPSLQALAARGMNRRYRKGVLLIQEGDTGDTLYVVLSGRVKAFSVDDRDREITYATYGAGDYFGELMLDGGPRAASVITLDATVCAVVTRQSLRDHIAAHPDFAFELLSRVIGLARLATRSARSMALLDVYGRLTDHLKELAVARPDGSRLIAEPPTQRQLAASVGCSREMVSKLMKDLERGAYIAKSAAGISLLRSLPVRW